MVILHTFIALVSGFAVLMLLGTAVTALMRRLAPEWTAEAGKVEPGYAFVSLGLSFLSTAAGGYLTANLAAANPLVQVLALGIVVLALGAMSALQSKGRMPVWFLLAQVAIAPLGVLAGGLVWMRVQGIL